MDLSVVIPVYNEEDNINILYERLSIVVKKLNLSYEFIFINDKSIDNSLEKVKKLSENDNAVIYIDFSRNFGHQIAITAGLDYAKGNKIVIIDADLQDPPELIADMYKKMEQSSYNVIYAKRRKRKGESFIKRFTAKMFYHLLSKVASIDIPLDTGDFRIIDRKIADVLKKMNEQKKYIRGQIAWAGFEQGYIEYDRNERNTGKTGFSYKNMMRFALDGITSFSDAPLKFATFLGFFVVIIVFLIMLYALYSRFILHSYVQGWTSVILTVLFLGGVQLISIGIIGEYISRISANVRKRPLYIVNETNTEK
jgi:dolichol-phosphate mannosyltransferase